jgi:hypothetical protein
MTVEPLHVQVGALDTGGQLCIRSGRRVLTGRAASSQAFSHAGILRCSDTMFVVVGRGHGALPHELLTPAAMS